jgi:hypothetical protein
MSARTRDRTIDAARAYAIVGVVAGHWLVTGLVAGPDGLRTASPLSTRPALAPVTWALQTLGLFFFAGGYAAARSRLSGRSRPARSARTSARPGSPPDAQPRQRDREVRRLARPALALLAAWAPVLLIGAALGVPAATLRTIGTLVVSPLWFLLPYLALTAATGALCRVVARIGAAAALPPIAVVAAADAGLLPGWVAVPAAWAVPWMLGMSLAVRRGPTARAGALLAIGGAASLAALVCVAHYPASAVGVPGAGRSNLSPPSLVAVALAGTQIGIFLVLRAPLARLLVRDRLWRPIAGLNRVAVPVYLGHQSVLLGVAGAAALHHPAAAGLLTPPDQPGWVVDRVAWLPVLVLGLAFVTRERRHGEPGYFKRGLRGTLFDGSTSPELSTEVIAVRDSDPPSRGRAARQPL